MLHELGHTLGFAHTDVETAIMWATAKKDDAPDLDADDEWAMQRMYPPAAAPRLGSYVYAQNQAVDDTLPAATGGVRPFSYSLTPALPAGLSWSPSTRTITGTPTTVTSAATYTWTATDANQDVASTRFTIEVAAERVDLRGQPAKLVHPEGELEGAVVIFDGSSRCSEASGGIRFVIRGAEVAAEGVLPLAGGGPEPSVVTAGEAMLCDQAPSHFRGDVELRRGPDLVRAAQLRVSEGLRQLVATGNVRTIWHAAQGPGTDAPEEQTPEAAPERWEPERWEIRAERLNYSEDDAELRYTGSAHALLGEQSLECAELTVTTTPPESNASTGELEAGTLYCLGNAVLADAGFGRSVAADRAVYGFRDRVMSLSGNVVLRQGSDELRGPRLIYWLDESRYEIGESAALPAGVGEP